MERAVEWFVAITSLAAGVSHMVRSADWADAYRQLHACGRPGAFVNGGLCLAPGALIVAAHGSWDWPGAVITLFGWLLVGKGVVCLLAPGLTLQSMERGSRSQRGFVVAGAALLAIGAWGFFCLWHGARSA